MISQLQFEINFFLDKQATGASSSEIKRKRETSSQPEQPSAKRQNLQVRVKQLQLMYYY